MITREKMAVIFVQVLTGKKLNGQEAIQYLYDHDISTGLPETTTVKVTHIGSDGRAYTTNETKTYYPKTYESFNPKGYLTRAYVSAFFYRTQQKVETGEI